MILSRRSLLVSIGLHCSLVIGGYFLYESIEQEFVNPTEVGRSGIQVTSRAVTVERPSLPEPPGASSSPSSGSSRKPIVERPYEAPATQAPQPTTRPQSRVVTTRTTFRRAYPQAKNKPSNHSNSSGPTLPEPTTTPTPTNSSGPPPGWALERPNLPGDGGENGERSNVTRRAMPKSRPEFNLTERFPDLDSVEVKARFEIAEDGSYEPTLLTSTGNPTADVVILGKLLEFQWRPALEKGVPKRDTRILDISLEG